MEDFEAIGIDFGTSYCRVCVSKNGKIEVLQFDGKEEIPSVVAFTDNGRLIGEETLKKDAKPENTIYQIKRFIGTTSTTEKETTDLRRHLPFRVKNEDSNWCFEVNVEGSAQTVRFQQLLHLLIQKIKQKAEDFLGHAVKLAVISVPASYNNSQRKQTCRAALTAGFEHVQLMNEPTAVAIYHSQKTKYKEAKNAIIVCLGGGSLDVSVATIDKNKIAMKVTTGNSNLGGYDFDQRLMEHVIADIEKKYDSDVWNNARTIQKIANACEKAKKTVSEAFGAKIEVDDLVIGVNYSLWLNRSTFEKLCEDLFEVINKTVGSVLDESKLPLHEPHDVVFVGGSTMIPKVQSMIPAYFLSRKREVHNYPERAVVQGARIQAIINAKLTRKEKISLAIKEISTRKFSIKNGGKESLVVNRNEPIPINRCFPFSTLTNNQTYAKVEVIDEDVNSSRSITEKFVISGVPVANKGDAVIEMMFDFDASGILVASANAKLNGTFHNLDVNVVGEEADDMAIISRKIRDKQNQTQERTRVDTETQLAIAQEQVSQTPPGAKTEKLTPSTSKSVIPKTEHNVYNRSNEKHYCVDSSSSSSSPEKLPHIEQKIGIDLGTTFSSVGVYRNGKLDVIQNEESNRRTPSVVTFTKKELLVGGAALNNGFRNINNTIFNTKRMIGRPHSDVNLQSDMHYLSYYIENKNDEPLIGVQFKSEMKKFTPEEISAMIIRKNKKLAENYIGREVTDAVITVPTCFNDSQRRATIDAATIAGLNKIELINESTASAIAYGYANQIVDKRNVLFFHLGGGTCDATIISISDVCNYKVISTAGDSHFGGTDFDQKMIEYHANEIKKKHSKDIFANRRALYRLRILCEEAKKKLSRSSYAQFEVDFLGDHDHHSVSITREQFEIVCKDLFEKPIQLVRQVLRDANLLKSDIDDLVLIGGSTRIPRIQEDLKKLFRGTEFRFSINQDEAAVEGAALLAALPQLSDPRLANMQYQDVTSFGISVRCGGGTMMELIRQNTPLPVVKELRLRIETNRTTCELFESDGSHSHHKLGEFEITQTPNSQCDAKFEVNRNGILTVSVTDNLEGRSEPVSIRTKRNGFSKTNIYRMIDDARKIEWENNEYHSITEAKNQLEELVLKAQHFLDEKRDRMNPDSVSNIISACYTATETMEKTDITLETIRSIITTLDELVRPLLLRYLN